MFLGDTYFGETYQSDRLDKGKENILVTRGYEPALATMQGLLAKANLDTPVTALDVSPCVGKKSFIHKADPIKTPETLAKFGFGAVSLANSHALDYGEEGLRQTLALLNDVGVTSFGVGVDRSVADKPLLLDLRHGDRLLKIAVFGAFVPPVANGVSNEPEDLTADQNGRLDPARISAQIRELRGTHPDLLAIAFPHWGRGYKERNAQQVAMSESLMDAGIDLVLGHGSHMMQEIAPLTGK